MRGIVSLKGPTPDPSPNFRGGERLNGCGGWDRRRPARWSGEGPLHQRQRASALRTIWHARVMGERGVVGVGVTGQPGQGRFRACPRPHRPEGMRLYGNTEHMTCLSRAGVQG
jgi:hypothetical protein